MFSLNSFEKARNWLQAKAIRVRDLFFPPAETLDPTKEEADDIDQLSQFFSTSASILQSGKARLVQYISDNAIPVVPDFKLEIEGTGMDQVNDANKAAFSMNQQAVATPLFAWYASQGFIGYQACGVIAQQWLVEKACRMKGRDAVRNGFEITANDGIELDAEVIPCMVKLDRKYKLKRNLIQAHKFNNVFGIRHILFKVESSDPEYYEKPFNPDGIKPGTYQGMSQIDPYWITPWLDAEAVSDQTSQYFYEPTYWMVQGKRIHRSHFVILRGAEVGDVLKPSYIYGGIPLTQRIMERVYASERTANEAPMLAQSKRLNVRKMDLSKAVAKQKQFEQTLQLAGQFRDNYGVLVAGKDEEVMQLETSLADLDATIMTQYQLVASIADVPATKLLGTSPKGFNATGEHEIKTYHEELESIQEEEFSLIVEKHHLCMIKSDIAPKFNLPEDFECEVEWRPVDVPSAKEEAEINQINAQTDQLLQATGAIDAYEVRDRVIGDKISGYNGLETLERPDYEDPEELEPLTVKKAPGTEINPEPTELGKDSYTAMDVLRKEGSQWFVYSEKGKKLGGPYQNEGEAKKRLAEIEYFKNKG